MAHGPSLFAGHFAGPITRVRGDPPAGNPPAPIPPTRPWLIPPRISGGTDGGDDPGDPNVWKNQPWEPFNPAALGGRLSFGNWARGYDDITYAGFSPQELAEQYAASGPSPPPSMSSSSIGEMLSNYTSNPTNLIGHVLGFGIPGAGLAASWGLEKIAELAQNRMARDYALAAQGEEGYGTGMIDGQPYTVGPSLFGPGQSITGTVPPGFTMDMHLERVAAQAAAEGEEAPTGGGQSAESAAAAAQQDIDDEELGDFDPGWNAGGLVTADRGLWPRPPSNVRRGLGSLADAPWGDLARMDLSRLGRRW